VTGRHRHVSLLSQTICVPALFPSGLTLCRVSRLVVLRVLQCGRMYPNPEFLLHLCGQRDWEAAHSVGELCPASLAEVGFIHLSTSEQVHLPANRLYAGRTDLVLLHINPRVLDSPLRWEPGTPTDPESMRFPHLYGRLPVSAVINVTPYLPGPDGRFPPFESST
jgi:uncharacterized protein (DUF952 family)